MQSSSDETTLSINAAELALKTDTLQMLTNCPEIYRLCDPSNAMPYPLRLCQQKLFTLLDHAYIIY